MLRGERLWGRIESELVISPAIYIAGWAYPLADTHAAHHKFARQFSFTQLIVSPAPAAITTPLPTRGPIFLDLRVKSGSIRSLAWH